MKSSEDIARDHLFDEMEEVDHFEKHEWTPPEWLLKAMQSHTTATLDTLKERVKEKELVEMDDCNEDYNRGYMNGAATMRCILQEIIDGVRNE